MSISTDTPSNTGKGEEAALGEALENISDESQQLVEDFIKGQPGSFDPLGINQAFMAVSMELWKNPDKILDAQKQAVNSWFDLWTNTVNRMFDSNTTASETSKSTDRRFRHDAWNDHPFFDFIKQSYLLTANTVHSVVKDVDGLDEKTRKKAEFYTRQFIDAMSPGNFVMTNPEVIESTIHSNGENLLKGLQNFCKDFDAESGQLRIRMADLDAFELGKNVAVSEGKVIFQNDLMQLIQYSPATETVFKRPLLIVPPWINKFYILDLQPKNSLVKWLTEQGHTVFVISWVNPDENLRDMDFADYVFEGPIAALDAIKLATDESDVNLIGYCIGGTLLSALLAYMQAKGDDRIASATFMTSLIDFSEPGDLGVFIDEMQISNLEDKMNSRGFHDGREMALTFNMLRANDLIWSFYINNYLLGKSPLEFDLLYWNSDSTRMPAKMHSTYLRKMYLENTFKEPGGISVGDVPIDVSTIQTPSYFISTEDDHIAPWKSTFLGAGLFSGPVRFVLGKSGHIAGIVNHPDSGKYGYYTGPAPAGSPDEWYNRLESHTGSWWPDWQQWVTEFTGERVPARVPGECALPALEDAPGSYVRVKC